MYQLLPTNQELVSAALVSIGVYMLQIPASAQLAQFLPASIAAPAGIFVITLVAQKVSSYIHV